MVKTFKQNLEGLEGIEGIKEITLFHKGQEIANILNKEGKRGSLQVYANILEFGNKPISKDMAKEGLNLFSEYVFEAMGNPGKHPNIDLLLKIRDLGYDLDAVIEYKE
tara:strand:+ start:775 stop:1098 length:324 start_codon:yes stop_codon:yes gene_type:complete